MSFIGKSLCLVGLYLIYESIPGQKVAGHGFDSEVIFSYGILGVIILASGLITVLSATIRKQNQKNEESVRRWASGDFQGQAIYLRPFEVDGVFEISRRHFNLFSWGQYARPGQDSFERSLDDAGERSYPLHSLGMRSADRFGPAVGGFFEDWREKVGKAIESSSRIFIIPSANPGTLWEIGEIKRLGAFGKTVFILPPSDHLITYHGQVPYEDKWRAAAEACFATHQFKLPHFRAAGLLFIYNHAGKIVGHATPKFRSPRKLAAQIRDLFPY